jgi:hypothetical protein
LYKRQDNTINPTQRLTPTRRKVITRSRSRAQTNINRLSLYSLSSSSTRRSPNNYPEYSRCRLSVVKHQQLARQVGAFDAIAFKSSRDLKIISVIRGNPDYHGNDNLPTTCGGTPCLKPAASTRLGFWSNQHQESQQGKAHDQIGICLACTPYRQSRR